MFGAAAAPGPPWSGPADCLATPAGSKHPAAGLPPAEQGGAAAPNIPPTSHANPKRAPAAANDGTNTPVLDPTIAYHADENTPASPDNHTTAPDATAATSKHASSDPSHTPAAGNDNPAEPKSSPTSAAAAGYSGQGAGCPASRVASPVHLQPHPPPLTHRGPAWHDRRGHQPSPAALQFATIHPPPPVQPAAGQQPDPATGDGQQQQSNPGSTQRCHIGLPDVDQRGWDGVEPFHAGAANLHQPAATQPQYHRPHLPGED